MFIKFLLKSTGEYEEQLKEENLAFLFKFTLLKNQPQNELLSLLKETKTLTLYRNRVVYDFGDRCDLIYLVKEGEIEVIIHCGVILTML